MFCAGRNRMEVGPSGLRPHSAASTFGKPILRAKKGSVGANLRKALPRSMCSSCPGLGPELVRVLAGVDVGLEFHARYLLSIQFVWSLSRSHTEGRGLGTGSITWPNKF